MLFSFFLVRFRGGVVGEDEDSAANGRVTWLRRLGDGVTGRFSFFPPEGRFDGSSVVRAAASERAADDRVLMLKRRKWNVQARSTIDFLDPTSH